jgi:ribosomal protein S18 acetylase RimI-like enzyme
MIAIRLIDPEERPALAPLVAELLGHYRMAVSERTAIERALADQPLGVETLMASGLEGPLGFASFAQLFPGLGIAPQIYMKELYVSADARGRGVGEALMRALARLAEARGCTRVDWSTQQGNAGALAFYARIGAKVVEDKVYLRLDAAGIAALAREG